MKSCFRCGAEKPLSEYYKHDQMADGHLNKCKCCTKMDARARRFDPASREKVLAYDKRRGGRQGSEYMRAYRQRNPEAYRAHRAVSNALRDGSLERPSKCSHCHCDCKPHGHHHDYSRPLDVVWLCAACHHQLHALMDTVKKAMSA